MIRPMFALTLALALSATTLTYSATKANKETPPAITAIKTKFTQIETNASLKSETASFECDSGETGAKVELFKDQAEVRKATIQTHLPGEGGWDQMNYYYSEGKPIFALTTTVGYQNLEQSPTMKHTQTRYYFENGKAILCLRKEGIAKTSGMQAALDAAINKAIQCTDAPAQIKRATAAAEGEKSLGKLRALIFGKDCRSKLGTAKAEVKSAPLPAQ